MPNFETTRVNDRHDYSYYDAMSDTYEFTHDMYRPKYGVSM